MAFAGILLLAGALASPRAEGKLRFVATLPDLKSIVEAVGGERVEGIAICAGVQDPHFVDPKPTYIVKLRQADLFVKNGLDLEIGWEQPLLDGAHNPKIHRGSAGYLDASIGIPVIEIPPSGTTRAAGDVHPFGNPHYLLDPLNGKIVARSIAQKLSILDPEGTTFYSRRAEEFCAKLDEAVFGKELVELVGGEKLDRLAREGELDSFLQSTRAEEKPLEDRAGGWLGSLRRLENRKIVAFHKNLNYFAGRFGLEVVAYVEPKPGIPPSAEHLVKVVDQVKAKGVRTILTHGFYDDRAPAFVAERTGAAVVVVPAAVGGAPEAKDYLSLFDVIVEKLTAPR